MSSPSPLSPSSGRSHQLSLAKLERDTYVRVYFVRDGVAGAVLGALKGLTRTDARIADASGEIVEIPFASMTQVSVPDLAARSESSVSAMPDVVSMLAALVLIMALATLVYGTRRLSFGDLAIRVIGIGAPIGYLTGGWFAERVNDERRGLVVELSVAAAVGAAWLGMYAVGKVPALHATVPMLATLVGVTPVGAIVAAAVSSARKATVG